MRSTVTFDEEGKLVQKSYNVTHIPSMYQNVLDVTDMKTENLLIFLRSKKFSSETLTSIIREGRNLISSDLILEIFAAIHSLQLEELKEEFASFDADSYLKDELEALEKEREFLAFQRSIICSQTNKVENETDK